MKRSLVAQFQNDYVLVDKSKVTSVKAGKANNILDHFYFVQNGKLFKRKRVSSFLMNQDNRVLEHLLAELKNDQEWNSVYSDIIIEKIPLVSI